MESRAARRQPFIMRTSLEDDLEDEFGVRD